MKKRFLLLGMASVFALTGCHGTKKVEFKEFGEEVKKLEEPKIEKVKVSGKVESESFKAFTVELKSMEEMQKQYEALDEKQKKAFEAAYSTSYVKTVASALAIAYALSEDAISGMTFYVGNGFKITSEKDGTKAKAEYDKKGLLVSSKSVKDKKVTKLSLKWTLEK